MPTLTQFTLVDHITIDAVTQQFRSVGIDNCYKSTVIEAIMDKIKPTFERKCSELRKLINTIEQKIAKDESTMRSMEDSAKSLRELKEYYEDNLKDYKAAGMTSQYETTKVTIEQFKNNISTVEENVKTCKNDIKEYNTQIKELQKQIKDINNRASKDYKFIVRDSEVFAIYKESLNLNKFPGNVINDVGDNHKKNDEDIYRFIGGTVTGYKLYNSANAA